MDSDVPKFEMVSSSLSYLSFDGDEGVDIKTRIFELDARMKCILFTSRKILHNSDGIVIVNAYCKYLTNVIN